MRLRSVVIGWTILAGIGWFLFGVLPAEGDCTNSESICIAGKWLLLIAAVYIGGVWLTGLLLLGAVAGLVRWHRKLTSKD